MANKEAKISAVDAWNDLLGCCERGDMTGAAKAARDLTRQRRIPQPRGDISTTVWTFSSALAIGFQAIADTLKAREAHRKRQ